MKARILIMTTIEDSAGNTIAEMTSHFTGMLGDNPRYLTEALEAAQQAAYHKHLLRWGGVAWDWDLTNVEGRFMPDEYTDAWGGRKSKTRSEEHTSELQSRLHLVCRPLREKKKQQDGL